MTDTQPDDAQACADADAARRLIESWGTEEGNSWESGSSLPIIIIALGLVVFVALLVR